jgi:hypothetical protein
VNILEQHLVRLEILPLGYLLSTCYVPGIVVSTKKMALSLPLNCLQQPEEKPGNYFHSTVANAVQSH